MCGVPMPNWSSFKVIYSFVLTVGIVFYKLAAMNNNQKQYIIIKLITHCL